MSFWIVNADGFSLNLDLSPFINLLINYLVDLIIDVRNFYRY